MLREPELRPVHVLALIYQHVLLRPRLEPELSRKVNHVVEVNRFQLVGGTLGALADHLRPIIARYNFVDDAKRFDNVVEFRLRLRLTVLHEPDQAKEVVIEISPHVVRAQNEFSADHVRRLLRHALVVAGYDAGDCLAFVRIDLDLVAEV